LEQQHDPIDDGFGTRGAARDKYIYRKDFVDPSNDIVTTVKNASGGAA